MRIAVCQCADTGPLESLVVLLGAAGYQCHTLSDTLIGQLKRLGCDTVADISTTMRREGVERPMSLPVADASILQQADLYVDVKAQRNGPKVWEAWPRLRARTLWYRINGGEPTIVPGAGDEINPICPILTPNLWYGTRGPWSERAYACCPPFYRFDEYYPRHGRSIAYTAPLCLVHNLTGWGFGGWADGMRALGMQMHGNGSPDGLLPHATLRKRLASALAMVHLKTNDAPGYALYEALAAACPVLVSQRLILKCLMHDLFVDGETCLVYDRVEPARVHHGHTPEEIVTGTAEVAVHLERLRDPAENARIGLAGRERLRELMWSEERDGDSVRQWFGRMFP